MKQSLGLAMAAAIVLCGGLHGAWAQSNWTQPVWAQPVWAQPVYTEQGGGEFGRMENPNHIDFMLQFNNQLDHNGGVRDGAGLWIGYRYSINPVFSFGVKLGAHAYTIVNGSSNDKVSSAPLLFTAQAERNFNHAFNLYAQMGMGPSFNKISGDQTNAYGLKLETSFAFDMCFGATVEMTRNLALGANLDWFISSARIKSDFSGAGDHLNVSHLGLGAVVVVSF
ncbi:MAG: outer membrane beta-barrel protein [Planctomycetota bacterium]